VEKRPLRPLRAVQLRHSPASCREKLQRKSTAVKIRSPKSQRLAVVHRNTSQKIHRGRKTLPRTMPQCQPPSFRHPMSMSEGFDQGCCSYPKNLENPDKMGYSKVVGEKWGGKEKVEFFLLGMFFCPQFLILRSSGCSLCEEVSFIFYISMPKFLPGKVGGFIPSGKWQPRLIR